MVEWYILFGHWQRSHFYKIKKKYLVIKDDWLLQLFVMWVDQIKWIEIKKKFHVKFNMKKKKYNKRKNSIFPKNYNESKLFSFFFHSIDRNHWLKLKHKRFQREKNISYRMTCSCHIWHLHAVYDPFKRFC